MSNPAETLGACLRRWRGPLTQAQLAALAKIDQSTISAVERGTRGLSREALADIARACGVSEADLGRAVLAPLTTDPQPSVEA